MPTIAIVPSDVPSKRMLAERLGRLLVVAGHRVVMLVDVSDGAAVASMFEHRLVATRSRPGPALHPRRPLGLRRARRNAATELDPADFTAVLAEVAPDLLIIDIEEYEALILALALSPRPPLAVLCSFFEVWPIAGLGPNDPGPVGGPIERARGNLRWPWMWFRFRVYDLRQHFLSGELDRISVSRVLARRLGVRRLVTARQWLHPFAPRSLPMLVCNALELDIAHDPRPGVVHIGSLLDPVAPDAAAAIEDHRLAAVVDRARTRGRPLVVCAFGTLMTGDRSALVQRVGSLARLRPDIEFVVGIDDVDATFEQLPNVYAAAWIPQRELLTVADAAFVHTGNATLHECVAARVPMLVHPFQVNDQPRNAARVVRHGIGALDVGLGSDIVELAARLDAVLDDDDMRRRIGELADRIAWYERDGVAVAAVEGLLGSSDGHAR